MQIGARSGPELAQHWCSASQTGHTWFGIVSAVLVDHDLPLFSRLHLIARRQDGCVHIAQLVAAGISPATVQSLVRRGALTRVLFGVYVVGPPELTQRQAMRVALLRAGHQALLSHHTAAALDGWVAERPGEIWLTAPGQRKELVLETLVPVVQTDAAAEIRLLGSRRALRAHQIDGLPATTPADTVVAIAGQESPTMALAAWREADFRNRLRADAVVRAIGRGIAGSALIRELLDAYPIVSNDETDVRTWGEFLLLEAMIELGLPRPLTNAPLQLPGRTYFPDFRFPARTWSATLVAEVDGGVHKRATRLRADRARDAHMRQVGIDVLRIPDDEVQADPLEAARQVERRLVALGQSRAAA